MYGVVPFAVEWRGDEANVGHRFVGYPTPRRVLAPVQAAGHFQTGGRRRACDQIDDRLVVAQRFAAPVGGDEGEEAVLDFVPFARTGRKVAHGDGQAGVVCKLLQRDFPHCRPVLT